MTCFSLLALSNITLNKKNEIIQLCRHCWSTDPFTLGGYSYPGPQTRAQARIILLVNVRNGKYFQIPRIKRFSKFRNYKVFLRITTFAIQRSLYLRHYFLPQSSHTCKIFPRLRTTAAWCHRAQRRRIQDCCLLGSTPTQLTGKQFLILKFLSSKEIRFFSWATLDWSYDHP